jgi:hypothetical protein
MLALLVVALALQAPGPRATPPPSAPPAAPALPAPPQPLGQVGPLRGEWPERPSGKRITLTSPMTVDDALDKISDAAGWNVVRNTGRTGARTIGLKLRDVPVEDALRAALAGTGLVATRTGGTVVVAEGADVPRAVPVLSGFDTPTGKRFTGDFDDEELPGALRQIAQAADLSIVLPAGELGGTFTASFKNIPVEDALRAVLAQGGLTARRDGALLVVQRAESVLDGLLPGLSRDARRSAEDAIREAKDAVRRAHGHDREARDLDRKRDREVTGSDLTIAGGEDVRDVSVVRGNLLLQGGASARDATAVSGWVKLDPGASAHDVVAVLGSATLAGGASARQVVAVFGDVNVGPGAEVAQDVISIGGKVNVDPGAEVGGASHAITLPQLPHFVGISVGDMLSAWASPWLMLLKIIGWFAVLFGLGLLATWIMPRRYEVVSNLIASDPVSSVLAGLLGILGAALLSVLLTVTVVGALLVPVLVLALLAGGLLGLTAMNLRIGQAIPFPTGDRSAVLQLAVGTLVFVVLGELPVVGWMVWIAAVLLAVGATVRTRFGQRPGMVLPTTPAPPAAV